MNALLQLIDRGGWVMPVIITLSVVLYSRCFRLLFSLWRLRRQLRQPLSRAARHSLQTEARESFRRQRAAIGPMIAAAPLLGLLGTVSGMEKTFESLSAAAGEKSMEGLASGISEVLAATESGLTVAIPAMLLVYLAHREVNSQVQTVNRLERHAVPTGGRP
ncbi:colicin uptake protein TolQ [Lacunisphaera limnophila]|uniref:Colicin uptake protein TolQ n=1 Tax=Lacunisphaera limnophila TaxID=1838286 RepID=A0A1D8ASI6_9BACT|nr:MotA/TolQ/ExbB proton channel family protein [Lacunisphaera limnophila]AOS43858.1 colicin uptake protein TolQ [Lacunisphaera limnophila]